MKDLFGNDIRCYTECKVCYTEREAGSILNNTSRHNKFRGKNIPKRKYFCAACGFYHLTHYKYFADDKKISYNERKFYALCS